MNLFVARLNPSTTARDLQKLFSHYGIVTTVKVIFDHDTGRSKGYGFIEMPNIFEAHEALRELDETKFQESIISVIESKSSDGRFPESRPDFSDRNYATTKSRNNNVRESIHNSFSINKTHLEEKSLRNFGYRGSGKRSFR